jgi:hypothetical protein
MVPPGDLLTPAQAYEALTDAALFITVYVSLVATLAGIEVPETNARGEIVARAIAYWMCAVGGVIMLIWLIFALLVRIGLVAVALH